MNKNYPALLARASLVMAVASPALTHAQVTLKPDGEWRSLFSAGASLARGNTSATSLSASADVVRLTDDDKWALNANAQYGRSDAEQTTNRLAATGLHSRNFTPDWFGFGQLDLLRDTPANLSLRATLGGGVGYHLMKGEAHTWDLSAGVCSQPRATVSCAAATSTPTCCWPRSRATSSPRAPASSRSCRSTRT